jgi:CheY-like chemotaxis protein
VLVVDDCALDRERLTEVLGARGIEVEVACDGAQAVWLATAIEFDLVVMDLAMPVLDGVAATRRIRTHEARHPSQRATSIVAHTALDVAPDSQMFVRVGLNGILPRPASAFSLKSCIKRWCPQAVLVPTAGEAWRSPQAPCVPTAGGDRSTRDGADG